MKMQQVVEIAKQWGIPYKIGFSKEKLIREIQIKEGYQPCFRRQSFCDEKECLWMDECLPTGGPHVDA